MGGKGVPDKPVVFQKPLSTVVSYETPKVVIPNKEIHHEIELGVVIGKTASKISEESAMDHVAGYFLALDLTAREDQAAAKKSGLPWDLSKGFDGSLPLSSFVELSSVRDPHNLDLEFKVKHNTGFGKQSSLTHKILVSPCFIDQR